MSARRPWLLPLVPLYGAGVAAKDWLTGCRFLPCHSLTHPVISVGSLSAGGAGKTPVVMLLARLLEEQQMRVAILSRGYGRTSRQTMTVTCSPSASTDHFGDEPVEMMRAGLHVFVGAERKDAGLLAEKAFAPDVHLLDDGFQHRRLCRALDIVLLTAADVADCLLPAGNLREPLRSLRRAGVVVLREEEKDALRAVVTRHTQADVWIIRRELVVEQRFARPFAFCGIARPGDFLRMLESAGHPPLGSILFPDHHPFTSGDLERILRAARTADADGFYLTRKDLVRIPELWVERLQAIGPLHAPLLRVSLEDPAAAVARMLGVLGG